MILLRRLLGGAAAAAALVACAAHRDPGALEPRWVAVHNALAATGLAAVGPVQQGSLAEGREARFTAELPAGCATVVGLGGEGVRDLDVTVLDADGKALAHDTTADAEASLRVCAPMAATYTFLVKMAAGQGTFTVGTWAGAPGPAGAPASAAGDATAGLGTCEAPIVLAPSNAKVRGNTRRGESIEAGSCSQQPDAREIVYRLDLAARRRVILDASADFDTLMYVRKDACDDATAEVACNDDAPSLPRGGTTGKGSRLDLVLEPGTYFVFVDGYKVDEAGMFSLDVKVGDAPTLADTCRAVGPTLASGGARVRGALDAETVTDHSESSCAGAALGPDVPYRLAVDARERIRVTEHASDFSPAIHLRRTCDDVRTELGCGVDTKAARGGDAVWSGTLDPGTYTVFADSVERDANGRFTLATERADEGGAGVRGDDCGNAYALGIDERTVEGDTFYARDDVAPRCAAAGGADVVYRLEITKRTRFRARIKSEEAQHVMALSRACADPAAEIACGVTVDEKLSPGMYYLTVDAAVPGALGRYALAVETRDATAEEDACKNAPRLEPGKTTSGTSEGAGDKFDTSCAGRREGQASDDRVYAIVVPTKSTVRLVLTTPTWDGVLALRARCEGTTKSEIACNNDDRNDAHRARIETTLEAGTYYAIVDGHQARNAGGFTLSYEVVR